MLFLIEKKTFFVGSYDLAQFDFIFTLQPGENPYQKSEKKKVTKKKIWKIIFFVKKITKFLIIVKKKTILFFVLMTNGFEMKISKLFNFFQRVLDYKKDFQNILQVSFVFQKNRFYLKKNEKKL